MTTPNVSADFARATRRSQVAYGLTSFAYLRCGVVVGTSFGNVMLFRGIVAGNIIIISRRFVGTVGTLATRLGGTFVASIARVSTKQLDRMVA